MNEKRPTKGEAVNAIGLPGPGSELSERARDLVNSAMVQAMHRTAALFGGFAPEPTSVRHLAQADQVADGREVLWLPPAEMAAVFARSNAWPETLAGVRKAINYLGGDPHQPGIGPPSVDAALATLRSLEASMSSPEFGTGPEVKP